MSNDDTIVTDENYDIDPALLQLFIGAGLYESGDRTEFNQIQDIMQVLGVSTLDELLGLAPAPERPSDAPLIEPSELAGDWFIADKARVWDNHPIMGSSMSKLYENEDLNKVVTEAIAQFQENPDQMVGLFDDGSSFSRDDLESKLRTIFQDAQPDIARENRERQEADHRYLQQEAIRAEEQRNFDSFNNRSNVFEQLGSPSEDELIDKFMSAAGLERLQTSKQSLDPIGELGVPTNFDDTATRPTPEAAASTRLDLASLPFARPDDDPAFTAALRAEAGSAAPSMREQMFNSPIGGTAAAAARRGIDQPIAPTGRSVDVFTPESDQDFRALGYQSLAKELAGDKIESLKQRTIESPRAQRAQSNQEILQALLRQIRPEEK